MFVNRVPELTIIEDNFTGFFNQKELNRYYPAVIGFYGVKGIGKTRLLQKFTETLLVTNTRYIEAQFHPDVSIFAQRIIGQLQKYMPQIYSDNEQQGGTYAQFIQHIKALLDQGPLVLLLDAIDAINESQIEPLETMLGELVAYQTLFVVLAGRQRMTFENVRTVRQKLKTYILGPFDQEYSYTYLKQLDASLSLEQCQIIFDWTRGYPLAMNEMVKALHDGLDPMDDQEQKQIAQRMVDQIVMQDLLARINPDEQAWYQDILHLLAVPRRFNLVLLQQLIERFEPEHRLANSLAYLVLPRKIVQTTGVVKWDMAKSGYAMDEPIRHILQLNLKMNQPDHYMDLHNFLAQYNWQSASEVDGPERIRYQREFLYHSACSANTEQLTNQLTRIGTEIIQVTEEHSDQLVQFLEEYLQDTELQYILSPHTSLIANLIYENLAQKMYALYSEEAQVEKRLDFLRAFFFYTAKNSAFVNKVETLTPYIQQILDREDRTRILRLYEELGQDAEFRDAMGKDFDTLYAIISGTATSEG